MIRRIPNVHLPSPRINFFGGFFLAAIVGLLLAAPQSAAAATFTVDSVVDSVDASPGNGTCADALNRCTLRAAIMESNASSGPNTINVPAGTYILTIGPFDDEFNFDGAQDSFGDLDILNNNLTIIGAGSAGTIINGGAIDRVFDVNNFTAFGPSVDVVFQDLTITNGNAPLTPDGYQTPGGGIQFDGTDNTGPGVGTLTINNCRITSNTASGVGGGMEVIFGSLSIGGSEISSNTSTNASGGGVFFEAGASPGLRNLSITGSSVFDNHANNPIFGSGAGIWGGGNATKTINYNVITGNTAGTQGGGVFNSSGQLTMNFNVIVGNTAAGDSSSTGFKNGSGATTIENDWWGCNQGPSTSPCDRASGPTGFGIIKWLTLSHTATPNTIQVNQSTALQADFYTNNVGDAIDSTDLVALNGRAVTFNNPVLGTISGADPTISGGKANATFTAGPVGGNGSADATVDSATVTATILIGQEPTITCPANITVSNDADQCSASVSFSTTSTGTPAPTITCKIGATTITSPHVFPIGTTTVDCTATNGVGDDDSCSFTVTVNDTQNPTVTAPAAVSVNTGPGATSCSVVIDDATLGTATASDNCPGVSVVRTGVPAGNAFPVGTTVVTYTATDASGNTAVATQNVTVVDNTVPTITAPAAVSVNTGPGATSCSAVISDATLGSATANDNCPGVTITRTGVPAGNEFPVGTTIVTYTATDASGNTASATQSVTVTDNTAPTITAPAAVSVNTGAGATSCDAFVSDATLGTATASDNCGTATVTRSGVPAGNVFPVGTTTVTYTATDGNGNTATATQTVTVTDNTPPTITGPANASYQCPSQVPAANPSQATASDNCGSATITVSETNNGGAGSTASPLIITRTYTATDSNGNTATAVQTITVIDNTAPMFTFVPGNVTAFTGPGAVACSTVVSNATLGTATATDNCSVTVTRTGVPAGNVFPKGNTMITYTATDAAGNTTTATQTVTVIDNTPPTISCQANIVVDYNPAVNGAVVNYTTPVGSDNCAGASTIQTTGLASGSTFPLGTTTNTFKVTDASGLTAECSFTVTVSITSIIGLESVSITGSAYADSYNSTGGYPATKGSQANIVSNGTITMGGSGKVWGNVRSTQAGINMSGASQVTGNATAGTTVTLSGSASVGGTQTNNSPAPPVTLPLVTACGPPYSSNSGISGTYSYNSSTGNLTLSGVNIATLANGTYCFNNVTLTNSAQLKVNGPVVIKLTGTLNASGASSINNTTNIPSNLRILSSYTGSSGVTLGNSTNVYMVIYAPQTGVSISGAVPMFGTVAGKTLTLSNSGAIHYDTNLINVWPDIFMLLGP